MATELANSGPDVRQRLGELLVDPAALLAFLTRHQLDLSGQGAAWPPGERELRQVYALRRRIRRILRAGTEAELVEGANGLLVAARGPYLGPDVGRHPGPDPGPDPGPASGPDSDPNSPGGWRWYVATSERASLGDRLAVLIGVGLLGTLRTLGYERFRECAAPDCAGVLVDSSRAGRRRYCTPEVCGNRTNVARHRARRRTAVDHEPGDEYLR